MEGDEDGEGERGAAEEPRAPRHDDDRVVGEREEGGDEEDHEVAEGAEAGAEAEGIGATTEVHGGDGGRRRRRRRRGGGGIVAAPIETYD